MKSFYIVDNDTRIANLFFANPGYKKVARLKDADVVVFPGGADVSPGIYGHDKHPTTSSDPERDSRWWEMWKIIRDKDVVKVGICGGGQFLNCANFGKMYQDVDHHAMGGVHLCTYGSYKDGKEFMAGMYNVTSTHHQMMIPASDGEVWGFVSPTRCTYKDLSERQRKPIILQEPDTEIVYYSNTQTLCFQPHPEYGKLAESTAELFWRCVNRIWATNGHKRVGCAV